MAKGTTGYVHDNATVFNPDKSLRSNPLWAEVNWNDQHYPQLSQQFDQNSKVFTLFVNQPDEALTLIGCVCEVHGLKIAKATSCLQLVG